MPQSKRHHAVARLDAEDRGRLSRVLAGVVQAGPLGPRLIPIRVLGTTADAPGVAPFVKAGRLLQAAESYADLRAATDLVAQSAQEMGLDRFQSFLGHADAHLARTGGMVELVRDLPAPVTPTAPALAPAPAGPGTPPPIMPGMGAPSVAVPVIGSALIAEYDRREEERQQRESIKQFKLDPTNPADVAAARAFRWAQFHGPWVFDTPPSGPVMLAMAERVMRAVQADPTLLTRMLDGDRAAHATLMAAAQGKTVPTVAIETRNDEERALVTQLRSEGKSSKDIQTELDLRRANRKAGSAESATSGDRSPPVQQIPPEQLRFSQRTAGANGRTEMHRQHVRENGQISSPVDAVRTPDGIVTIDNTRVAVAREQGLATIPVRVWNPSDPLPKSMMPHRFGQSKTWGEALSYRVDRQRPELPPTGTKEIPILRERKAP